MTCLIAGETVTVRNIEQAFDELGEPTGATATETTVDNVVVCPGVTIGENCVIGAGSVVTRDIPANSFAAGNPCRVIRPITEADSMANKPEVLAGNSVRPKKED